MIVKKVKRAGKEIIKKEIQKIGKVREYRRTCRECGKVWHSLKSREKKIQGDIKSAESAKRLSGCGMCAGSWSALGAAEQAKRNIAAHQTELERLRECPNCGSHNYKEEVI